MTLSKREFMQSAWISITKRVPEGGMFDQVFCYNKNTGYFSSWPAELARDYAQHIVDGNEDRLSWDRIFTHWMPCYPPENGILYRDYVDKRYKFKPVIRDDGYVNELKKKTGRRS